ncbi:NYN domain-containing protein [Pelagibacterium lacus]|nr:NYN domain-containing protein [Pelagibacterium lacus]
MRKILARPALWLRILQRKTVRRPRIAILIDGDGVAPKNAKRVLQSVSRRGHISVQRVYGNFSGTTSRYWSKIISANGMVAHRMPTLVPGKNASDIALAIDAIELLLTHKIDIFVLIASDSDFTPLAHRIRAAGKHVMGFGQKTTPRPFRRACTKFQEMRPIPRVNLPALPLKTRFSRAEALLLPELRKLCVDGQPVSLSIFGQHIFEKMPDFEISAYGRRTLNKLLRALPSVEVLVVGGQHYARPAIVSPGLVEDLQRNVSSSEQ